MADPTPEDVYRVAAEAALRRHVGDDQAVAEWLDRTGRRPRMGLVGGIVLRSAAKIIQGQVEREERR